MLKSIMLLTLLPIITFAQAVTPPETVDQAVGLLPKLLEAIASGNHVIAYGIGIMILVVGVRQYVLPKINVGQDALPIITLILSSLGMAGASLVVPGASLGPAILNGVIAGIFASGAWDLIGKYIAKKLLGDLYKAPEVK
jgi:hypothetical protein